MHDKRGVIQCWLASVPQCLNRLLRQRQSTRNISHTAPQHIQESSTESTPHDTTHCVSAQVPLPAAAVSDDTD